MASPCTPPRSSAISTAGSHAPSRPSRQRTASPVPRTAIVPLQKRPVVPGTACKAIIEAFKRAQTGVDDEWTGMRKLYPTAVFGDAPKLVSWTPIKIALHAGLNQSSYVVHTGNRLVPRARLSPVRTVSAASMRVNRRESVAPAFGSWGEDEHDDSVEQARSTDHHRLLFPDIEEPFTVGADDNLTIGAQEDVVLEAALPTIPELNDIAEMDATFDESVEPGALSDASRTMNSAPRVDPGTNSRPQKRRRSTSGTDSSNTSYRRHRDNVDLATYVSFGVDRALDDWESENDSFENLQGSDNAQLASMARMCMQMKAEIQAVNKRIEANLPKKRKLEIKNIKLDSRYSVGEGEL